MYSARTSESASDLQDTFSVSPAGSAIVRLEVMNARSDVTHVFSMRFTTQALRSGASSSGNNMTSRDEASRRIARRRCKALPPRDFVESNQGRFQSGSRRRGAKNWCTPLD